VVKIAESDNWFTKEEIEELQKEANEYYKDKPVPCGLCSHYSECLKQYYKEFDKDGSIFKSVKGEVETLHLLHTLQKDIERGVLKVFIKCSDYYKYYKGRDIP
jgi:hypothetical protein